LVSLFLLDDRAIWLARSELAFNWAKLGLFTVEGIIVFRESSPEKGHRHRQPIEGDRVPRHLQGTAV
jgi:hypothetical protein